jgi:pyruvate dehydrogenase E2 component (dihydrolipoamide acetyltransferase)
MIEFKLPSLGADMDEGKLLQWKMKPGDTVKRGDVVAVVETPKAAVDVEIWQDGVVHELITQPGSTIPVGTVMARLLGAGEPAPTVAAAPAAAPAPAPALAIAPEPSRHAVSPAARKHARELGVDVDQLTGTGPHGSVTVEDVERAAKGKAPPVPDRTAEMRKAIAAAMSRSKREIPHYYLSETVSLERAAAWLEAENARRPLPERMLMAVLYLKAVALACKQYPDMNGHYVDNAFRPSASVHAGVAISLRQGGLIAPAIHEVEKLALPELMQKLADLVKRARAGSLRSSEMSDPTITVTNLGEGSVESVFGVIYPPQVALVGFGRIAQRPWAVDGALKAAPTVVASLAADHRVSDGHRGALFLAEIAKLLQQPETL